MTLSNQWNRTLYRLYTPLYDTLARPFETGRQHAIEKLDLTDGDRILVLGCGTGADLPYLPEKADVTAVDLVPAMVRRTKHRSEHLSCDADVVVADAQNLPFEEGRFDAVLLHLVLSVVPEPIRVVCETERVLSSTGCVSVYDKFVEAGKQPGALRRLLNPVARRLFSDLNRSLEPMLERTNLVITEREWIMHGLYTVAVARTEQNRDFHD